MDSKPPCLSQREVGWIGRWTDMLICGWMNSQTGGYVHGWVDGWTNKLVVQMEGQMDRCIDGLVDG